MFLLWLEGMAAPSPPGPGLAHHAYAHSTVWCLGHRNSDFFQLFFPQKGQLSTRICSAVSAQHVYCYAVASDAHLSPQSSPSLLACYLFLINLLVIHIRCPAALTHMQHSIRYYYYSASWGWRTTLGEGFKLWKAPWKIQSQQQGKRNRSQNAVPR